MRETRRPRSRNHTIRPSRHGSIDDCRRDRSRRSSTDSARHSDASTGAARRRSPPPSARRATSTTPTPSAPPTRRSTTAFGGYPHAIHYALKANSTLAHRAPAARARQPRRRQLAGRSRRGAALRLPPRPRSSSPAWARAPREIDRAVALGLLAINVESPGELDRIDQRAVAQGTRGARGAARQSRHRRQEPSRTSPPASSRTSSACRSTRRRRSFARWPRGRGLTPVGVARPHRLADHHARSAERAPPRRWSALARELRGEGIALSTSTWAAASASPTTAAPVLDPGRLRARARRRDRAAAA